MLYKYSRQICTNFISEPKFEPNFERRVGITVITA